MNTPEADLQYAIKTLTDQAKAIPVFKLTGTEDELDTVIRIYKSWLLRRLAEKSDTIRKEAIEAVVPVLCNPDKKYRDVKLYKLVRGLNETKWPSEFNLWKIAIASAVRKTGPAVTVLNSCRARILCQCLIGGMTKSEIERRYFRPFVDPYSEFSIATAGLIKIFQTITNREPDRTRVTT